MKLLVASVCLSLLSSKTVAFPAATSILPPVGGVSLASLTVDLEGGGCKPGEASVAIARDNSALTIIFDNFEAADGPNVGDIKTRSFCRVIIGINSQGYAFDVASVDFRGYVNVDKGAEASLVSRWKWIDVNGNDMKGKGNVKKVVTGPFRNDVLLHKDGELSDYEASVCQKKDAKVSISLSATVKSNVATANALVQGSSQDLGFSQKLNLSWKKC
ncbi:hypothetical protein BDU57DRAFT_561054 [Ampelomyces quisqualis]|uniref:Secreted protein n=1 Tax=Ampelomyces quisqualis TaxID=50730 RepID=A0A6A5R049_AMPQU|nr:hypothetical protein BDU57DRAFT_561054 [Ampelomyces quisqualis]